MGNHVSMSVGLCGGLSRLHRVGDEEYGLKGILYGENQSLHTLHPVEIIATELKKR